MRAFAWGMAALLVGLALLEISMQPTWPERIELGLIFLLMAVAMAGAAHWLPGVARRYRSIRITVAVLSLAAFLIVVMGAIAVGNRMFLSSHDLTLLLVVIAFGMVSAVGFAVAVSGPLTKDLDRLSTSADLVAKGDLDHELAIDRKDEIGRLSVSLDRMVHQLDDAEAARRDFFAAVGHDLRTPISSIQAAVESIRDGIADDPQAMLVTIEQDINVLGSLVEDVFLLARLDSGVVAPNEDIVDVTEIADETLEILRPLAAKQRVDLRLVSPTRILATADAFAVGRTLRNLVDNAVRHSPPGSTVTVRLTGSDGRVRVEVRDQGPGFEPEFVSIAFERFSRPEQARAKASGGSGLGLAIAKSLVEAMAGSIWIESTKGGLVVFELPGNHHATSSEFTPVIGVSSLNKTSTRAL